MDNRLTMKCEGYANMIAARHSHESCAADLTDSTFRVYGTVDGEIVRMTTKVFTTRGDAEHYRQTVHPDFEPFVA